MFSNVVANKSCQFLTKTCHRGFSDICQARRVYVLFRLHIDFTFILPSVTREDCPLCNSWIYRLWTDISMLKTGLGYAG